LIGQAIAIDPSQAGYHFHLAVTQQALNRMGEGQASYRRAIELQPALAAAITTWDCCCTPPVN